MNSSKESAEDKMNLQIGIPVVYTTLPIEADRRQGKALKNT